MNYTRENMKEIEIDRNLTKYIRHVSHCSISSVIVAVTTTFINCGSREFRQQSALLII